MRNISESVLARLKNESKKKGVSLQQLLNLFCQEEFIRRLSKSNYGEVFLVKELFMGYEWNRIPRKDRLLLGTLFLNHINRKAGRIQPIEKTTSG